MPRNRRTAVGRLTGTLLLVAVLAVVAAIPTSVVLTAGSRWADGHDVPLPPQLLAPPDAQGSQIYASDGKTLITTFYDEDRHDVGLAQIAPVMQKAIVAAEDTRFFEHGGVDLKGVARALITDGRSGYAAQGASTLTMQYVRNVLKEDPDLTQAQQQNATADTLSRKLREAQYAVKLEQKLTKTQILQNYLNIVYFGDGAYGIEAAAQRFFGTQPGKVDLAQAALLAGVVQSPDADNPVTGSRAAARTRQLYVLAAMAKSGAITPVQQAAAAAEKLSFHTKTTPNGCADAGGGSAGWGFYCDYLRRWWDAQPAFGSTAAARDLALRRGGYRVVTALSPDIQAEAARQSRSVYGEHSARALPIAVVQPGTGEVLALAVNRRYGTGPGETVNPLITGGGDLHGYPTGSTFKMFTMLAALAAGMPLSTGFDAPAKLPTDWPGTPPDTCDGGKYCPGNDNPSWMDGYRTMWDGFGRSVNTYFVHLEEQVGPAAVVAEAKKLGISFSAPHDAWMAGHDADSWGSFTLGVVDTTPLELAEAYATVASGGTYCKPLPVTSVTDPHGRRIPITPQCSRVLDPDVADAAADAARCPVGQQSAYGKCNGGTAQQVAGFFGGRPVAGKTGSTESNQTETFVGFTTTMAAAGTAADPADPGDHVGSGVESRVVNAVGRTLRAAVGDTGYPDFTAPSATVAFGG